MLLVRPGLDFFSLVFALFKAGVVPVVIDPGIGMRSIAQCCREAAPEAFIGIPRAIAAAADSWLGAADRRRIVWVGSGRRPRSGRMIKTLDDLRMRGQCALWNGGPMRRAAGHPWLGR